jgi:hypothetical protein
MTGAKTIARLLIAGFLLFSLATHAGALVATPVPFDTPVSEKLRAPFARFLSELGVTDVENTILASKGQEHRGLGNEPTLVIFRIIHPQSCTPDQEECMTVIGRIVDGIFSAEAIFYAGNTWNVGDVSPRILGVKSSKPISFFSKTSVVSVVNTAKGMMVIAQKPMELPR